MYLHFRSLRPSILQVWSTKAMFRGTVPTKLSKIMYTSRCILTPGVGWESPGSLLPSKRATVASLQWKTDRTKSTFLLSINLGSLFRKAKAEHLSSSHPLCLATPLENITRKTLDLPRLASLFSSCRCSSHPPIPPVGWLLASLLHRSSAKVSFPPLPMPSPVASASFIPTPAYHSARASPPSAAAAAAAPTPPSHSAALAF